MSTSFGGAYGDYQWEIAGRTLRVIARGCGVLKEFGPVFVTTDEQAQYAAQGRIDLNREELGALRRDRSTASANR